MKRKIIVGEEEQQQQQQQHIVRSVKDVYHSYKLHKAKQMKTLNKEKESKLIRIYRHYMDLYSNNNGDYLMKNILEAIDNNETECIIFTEYEEPDIALYDNDLIEMFKHVYKSKVGDDTLKLPSLESLLFETLTDEFITIRVGDNNNDSSSSLSHRYNKKIEYKLSWRHYVMPIEEVDENI